MIKLVAFFARRPDFTHEEFRAYYETRHVALIRSLLPRFDVYQRNYLSDPATREKLHFDVMTEAKFYTEELFKSVQSAMTDPAIASHIAQDEDHFMDRARSLMTMVEEQC